MAQRLSIDRAHPASPTEYGFQPKAPIDPPVQHHDAGPRPINVLSWIIWISAETVASAQFSPGLWHDLHDLRGALL